MTSIFLMLLLSVIRAQPLPSCPASCVVCSKNAVICQRLGNIIDAPDTTQALLLTEGSISTVQPASLSDLSNITVIGLSNNHISVLGEHSFRNLPFLHTLLLDHNLLTSQTLQGGALANLTQLEVLSLGHNLINMMQASWLKGTKALRSLKLDGNLLTTLDSGSFPLNDLRDLESLDLSDNLIDSLDRDSFRGLLGLRTLDLSRNRLSSAPPDAFSYLSWLTELNLVLNSWNCSCQLLELAAFLSSFMQQPDKVLYNGRRMVCVSADNPAVTTVLELTEANCVPSNRNITLKIETRDSVPPRLYARDLAITAVICFIGGVSLTLLVVFICYRVSSKKKRKRNEGQRESEEGDGATSNHLNHLNNPSAVNEKSASLYTGGRQMWEGEAVMLDARADGNQFRPRGDESAHYRCPDCRAEGPRPQPTMKWDNRMSGEAESEQERRQKMLVMMEQERRKQRNQQEFLGRRVIPQGNSNSSSHPRRDTSVQRPETLAGYRTSGEMVDLEGKSRGHEVLHCGGCQRTYRPPGPNLRQNRAHPNMRDSALFDGHHRPNDRGTYSHFDMMSNPRRETRTVTFDLESSKPWRDEADGETMESGRTSRNKDRKHKVKVHSGRPLKAKLSLSPLRKNKVHPKKKSDKGHSEKGSPKRSKDKRKGKKEKDETGAGGGTDKKVKGGKKKITRSTMTEEEEKEEVEEKNESSSKSEKNPSEGNQGGTTNPTNTQNPSVDTTNQQNTFKAHQGLMLPGAGVQYQGAGSIAGIPAFARNSTTSLSALASTVPQLTASNLSLQGASFLASGTSALLASVPVNSVAPNLGIVGSNVSLGVPGMSLTSPASSLLAQSGLANPLQASLSQTQVGGPAPPTQNLLASVPANPVAPNLGMVGSNASLGVPGMSLTSPASSLLAQSGLANPLQSSLLQTQVGGPAPPTQTPQSQPPPVSSSLVAKLEAEPGPQTAEVVPLPLSESQGPQGLPLPAQGPAVMDGSPEVLQAVENHSNSIQSEGVLARSVAGMEGPAMGGSEGSVPGNDGSVSGFGASPPAASTALLQQEYLSEEGGSSPRRKLRLVIPEKTSNREPTALERKLR